jgi:hypothetical protein
MKRTTVLLAAITLCAVCSTVYAAYVYSKEGLWPKSWPKELEPLRKSSHTYVGGNDVSRPGENYVIPFTDRKDFEAAWPHILKVKTKGAPLLLVRPNTWMNNIDAGVTIRCPPASTNLKAPLPEPTNPDDRRKWQGTTYLELAVDGKIVDLNRILLPADTPIIDQRF